MICDAKVTRRGGLVGQGGGLYSFEEVSNASNEDNMLTLRVRETLWSCVSDSRGLQAAEMWKQR